MEPDVGVAVVGEAGADGGAGVSGGVAVGAEVAEVEVFQAGGDDFGGDVGGGFVGEVAVAGEDALFDGPGAAAVGVEEVEVVIGFEDEGAGGADAFDDEAGGVAEVGEEADVAVAVVEHEADGVVGVVGDGEAVDLEVAELEGGAGFEEAPGGAGGEFGLERFGGEAVAVDGDVVAFGEDGEAAGVVAVFVGEEDGLHVGEGAAEGMEAGFDLAGAEAGVDEEAGVVGFEVGAVAAAAAAEDGESQHGGLCHFLGAGGEGKVLDGINRINGIRSEGRQF